MDIPREAVIESVRSQTRRECEDMATLSRNREARDKQRMRIGIERKHDLTLDLVLRYVNLVTQLMTKSRRTSKTKMHTKSKRSLKQFS